MSLHSPRPQHRIKLSPIEPTESYYKASKHKLWGTVFKYVEDTVWNRLQYDTRIRYGIIGLIIGLGVCCVIYGLYRKQIDEFVDRLIKEKVAIYRRRKSNAYYVSAKPFGTMRYNIVDGAKVSCYIIPNKSLKHIEYGPDDTIRLTIIYKEERIHLQYIYTCHIVIAETSFDQRAYYKIFGQMPMQFYMDTASNMKPPRASSSRIIRHTIYLYQSPPWLQKTDVAREGHIVHTS